MSLAAEINKRFHEPEIKVTLADVEIATPLRASVDLGYDAVTASCTLVYDTVPSGLDFRQHLVVEMGYGGFRAQVFAGYVLDDGREYYPFDNEIKALGHLHRAQYPYPTTVEYSNQTDIAIISDLLSRSAVTAVDIEGEGTTFGTIQPVQLKRGATTWDLINELDQVTGYATFDLPAEVRRRRISGAPDIADSEWTFTQGVNILSVRRPRTVQKVHNKVIVTGLEIGGSNVVSSTWQASSSYVPTPPTYIAYNFRSQLIETGAYASSVADRILQEQNRVLDVVEIEVPGNSVVGPGIVVSVEAAKIGLNSATAFWVKHVTHTFGPDGWITRLTLEGGALGTGGAVVTTEGEETTDVTYPNSPGGASTGGGRPYATVVVAASNSTATGASAADFACDGTADDETIESAIAACTANGRVLLLEGTYTLAGILTLDKSVTLEGQGVGTVLSCPVAGTMLQVTGNNATVKNLKIIDEGTNLYIEVTSDDVTFDSVTVADFGTSYGILATGDRLKVVNSHFSGNYQHMEIDSGDRCIVTGNTFTGNTTGVYALYFDEVTHCVFANNHVDGGRGISWAGGHSNSIVGNNIKQDSNVASNISAIVVALGNANAYNVNISGNTINTGRTSAIRLTSVDTAVITGNVAYGHIISGIFVDTCSNISVSGNSLYGPTGVEVYDSDTVLVGGNSMMNLTTISDDIWESGNTNLVDNGNAVST